ncbi:MAG: hypothetical protein AAGI30_13210 [Planctomycetota bacterium]
MTNRWPFADPPNLATVTLNRIFDDGRPITYASHDEDGTWQFLDGEDCTESDAAIVALKTIVDHDPTMRELAALPHGFAAVRGTIEGPWQVCPLPRQERRPIENTEHMI